MDINISRIKNQLQAGYQFVVNQGGKLAHHTVRVLKLALDAVRQDARLAGVTVAVSNILFIEIAVRIADLVDRLFTRLFGPEDTWTSIGTFVNSCAMLTLFSSTLVGMNIALYKGLKAPLTPLATGVISAAACISYIAFSVWRES